MHTGMMTIFATAIVATTVYTLYILSGTRFISLLTKRINNSVTRYETSLKFFSIDLSNEFESFLKHNPPSFDAMEALKRDGHSPVCVSVNSSMTRSDSDTPMSKPEIGSKTSGSLEEANETQPVYKVPNVVHYTFLGTGLKFTFSHYLSYRSVDRFIRPDQIFVHGDTIPKGIWWNLAVNEVPNIYHVNRTYSNNAPNGQPYNYKAHISDYMRAEILLRYGGIYLDLDTVVVKSFNELRQFSFVIGRENEHALGNGIMVAERGAPFLRLMLEQYHSYRGHKEPWNEKSVLNAEKLYRLYPHLVHVEETSLIRPNWKETAQVYDGRYNWTQNYAVHLSIGIWPEEKKPHGVEDILTKNTTFGEIARLALFGSQEIRKH